MNIIEILISVVLVFALLSILVSTLVEWVNNVRKTRGKMLKCSILQMLNDPLNLQYGFLLLKHPMIDVMNNQSEKRPFQYLASDVFANALVDVIGQQADLGLSIKKNKNNEFSTKDELVALTTMQKFENGLEQMNNSPFKDMLLSFYSKSGGDYGVLKVILENWFDNYMDRTTGWYKRNLHTKFIVVGMLVAFGLNVDSVHLFKVISMDENLRNNLVAVAEGVTQDYSQLDKEEQILYSKQMEVLNANIQEMSKNENDSNYSSIEPLLQGTRLLIKKISDSDSVRKSQISRVNEILVLSDQLGIPIGWDCEEAPLSWCFAEEKPIAAPTNKLGLYLYKRNYSNSWGSIFMYFLGTILTGFLLSFGAPFWFDILIKFVNIRKAGTKPVSTTKDV